MIWFKSNFRSRAQSEVSAAEAHQLIPRDRCIVFVQHNPSKWLACSGATVHVNTPPEFLNEPYLLVNQGTLVRPIPAPKMEEE